MSSLFRAAAAPLRKAAKCATISPNERTAASAAKGAETMKYAYRNAHLLDGTRDMLPRDGLAVLTDGETIAGIVPEEAVPEGFEPVDLGGKYLMPGLINLHVHLAGNGKPQKKQRDNEKLVRRLINRCLWLLYLYRPVHHVHVL